MITIEHEIRVARPVEEVFAFVADSRNDPSWCPPVLEVTQQSGSGPDLGATYEIVAKPVPVRTQGTFEIIDIEPNERATYGGENGMVRFRYGYTFLPEDEMTTVRMTSEVEPKGLWKIVQPIIRAGTNRVTAEEFENLKQLLEDETV